MGGLDRSIRNEAVTQRATIFGHNYQDETEYDLKAGAVTYQGGYSDLCGMLGINPTTGATVTPTPSGINSIRILQPHQGELVECYIDFFHVAFAMGAIAGVPTFDHNDCSVRFAIGDFIDNDFTTPRTSYTFEEIQASWLKISGKTTGIAGGVDNAVYGSRINLLPALKKAGDPLYVEDGFNLLMTFKDNLAAPSGSIGYAPFTPLAFRVVTSITGVK